MERRVLTTRLAPLKQASLFALALLAACSSIPQQEQAVLEAESSPTLEKGAVRPGVHTAEATQEQPKRQPEDYTELWPRLRAGFQLQPEYSHPEVEKQLSRYRDEQAYFDIVIERARPFLFDVVEQVDARGLPLELALVPFVESAFNPTAHSRQSAVGLWQFMPRTGRSHGLTQDWWIDERRDPRESTRAALDYLEALYTEFDQDWLLALAAYNTGGGNVRRAIKRRAAKTDFVAEQSPFWHLPVTGETRAHVPRILALARVIAAPEDHGVTLEAIANQPALVRVRVEQQIDLKRAADLAGVNLAELESLNPRFRQWATPPSPAQSLAFYPAAAQRFATALRELDSDSLVTFDRYAIKSGDTLGAIARRLGTRVEVLQRVNGLKGTRIVAGESLLVPQSNGAISASALATLEARRSTGVANVPSTYVVRSGDNLWSIARRYDLRSTDIRQLNGLELDSILQPGQRLKLASPDALSTATD